MPNEIWKPIPGYEGLYEVSDRGQVRSLDRMCPGRDGRSELHRGKVLRPQKLKNGYLEVKLRKDGVSKHSLIHHLVFAVISIVTILCPDQIRRSLYRPPIVIGL